MLLAFDFAALGHQAGGDDVIGQVDLQAAVLAQHQLEEIEHIARIKRRGVSCHQRGPGGGGNCPLTETDRTVVKHGVTLVGDTNLPALVAADASALYARNVLDFLKLVLGKDGGLQVDLTDDIVAACLMTQGGEVKRK